MFVDSGYSRLVIGYHGTDAAIVRDVISGKANLLESKNKYDWLGRGIYFWEYGPQRAWEWATEFSKRRPDRIQIPAVIGAYIQLGRCFDLMDTRCTAFLRDVYPPFCDFCKSRGDKLPENSRGSRKGDPDMTLRHLDCAVINWSLDELESRGEKFDSVRGIFVEGKRAFTGSNFRLKSHVQISVRDEAAILGYFIPLLPKPKKGGSIP